MREFLLVVWVNAVKHLFVAKLAESFGLSRVAESFCDFRYS
ncbi:hypothetical protein RMSM_02266 [Rhodopirellula maiorica SM1]|uniref:Uncharacterized protein n=1 Tax=Rhodopirellula maiorica SM1 TaxID=1265738 RepID=M5RNP2_9BACT|nr:hypothetical protein RMSM_02266 [Rhodopirellula maiorica SM1]